MESGHVEENMLFSRFLHPSFEFGHERWVICFHQLPDGMDNENLSAVFFTQLNGIVNLLLNHFTPKRSRRAHQPCH